MKTISCHEFQACNKYDCVMFRQEENADTPCWDSDGTLCHKHFIDNDVKDGREKQDFCNKCAYKVYLEGTLDQVLGKMSRNIKKVASQNN